MATEATNAKKLPLIHRAWWHPQKSWIDILVGFLLSKLLGFLRPFKPLKTLEGDSDNQARKEAHIKHAEAMRATLNKSILASLAGKNGGFRRWAASAGCEIVEATIKISRRDDLFQEWGITKAGEKIDYSLPDDSNITIHVAFPVTLLPEGVKRPTEINDFGCLVLEHDEILSILPKDIPVVLFFHGGGMTVGIPRMPEVVELLDAALKEDSVKSPVIYASVQYSLAPEHPFPAAPLEACSVVSHFLDHEYKLHLSGVSAGGYLALVAGLEAFRAHSNKMNIASILAACPMLSPASDSVSFYQNSASSHFCPVHFLRWSYRVYLELSDCNDTMDDESSSSDVFGRDSTRVEWSRSKWRKSSLHRLAEPAVDLPVNLGPKIIMTTNQADPLHNDGVAMFEKLKAAGADISHHDHRGSHWFGTVLDKEAYRDLAAAWKEAIFGGTV
jgi:acetyl esterase/lipase